MLPELSGYCASADHNGAVWQGMRAGMNAFLCMYQLVPVPTDCQASGLQVTGTPTVSVRCSCSRESSEFLASDINVLVTKFQIYLIIVTCPYCLLIEEFISYIEVKRGLLSYGEYIYQY
jgi:hypothetical protein